MEIHDTQAPSSGRTRFSKIDIQDLADRLNARGLDGWELVSTEYLTGVQGQTMYLLAL